MKSDKNLTRTALYIAVHDLFPDEIVGATALECEADLRGVTDAGRRGYAIPGYCSQPEVERCSECSLCNYGRDCHNYPVA